MKGNTEDERDTTEQPTSKKRRLADILKKQTTESSSAATEDRVSSEVEKYLYMLLIKIQPQTHYSGGKCMRRSTHISLG